MLTIDYKDSRIGEAFYKQMNESLLTLLKHDYGKVAVDLKKKDNRTILLMDGLESLSSDQKQGIISVFTNVTVANYFTKWMREWLQEAFYYEDETEIQAIIQTAKNISLPSPMEKQRYYSFDFLGWQREIYYKLAPFVENHVSFSFDSFLYFRLKPVREKLLYLAEDAIDEYKMELDYQLMLNRCRDLLRKQAPRVSVVYVYLKDKIEFMDEKRKKISIKQIYQWLETVTTFERSLPVHERIIGPLVSMAPEKIVVDSANCDDDLYHTLKNIFEERIVLADLQNNWQASAPIKNSSSFPS
ncbi:putative sporulation protein YtxC [Salipaludibacillus sp. CUR1]|uniref:putative sporulation protein YtxC n=1 Tax=Salipaludibacillus sp. CUR1 TaxID=2820003 RepID=UPI001E28F1F2|nr:putative sporulation protein YtxC [Salipaludibacillus sp. CUR1]MCE7793388.1 putative sporulation protein YtxC [Salipaludibacillus sp. CUR1]